MVVNNRAAYPRPEESWKKARRIGTDLVVEPPASSSASARAAIDAGYSGFGIASLDMIDDPRGAQQMSSPERSTGTCAWPESFWITVDAGRGEAIAGDQAPFQSSAQRAFSL